MDKLFYAFLMSAISMDAVNFSFFIVGNKLTVKKNILSRNEYPIAMTTWTFFIHPPPKVKRKMYRKFYFHWNYKMLVFSYGIRMKNVCIFLFSCPHSTNIFGHRINEMNFHVLFYFLLLVFESINNCVQSDPVYYHHHSYADHLLGSLN